MPGQTQRDGHDYALPIENRRYSRLKTCATTFVYGPCHALIMDHPNQ